MTTGLRAAVAEGVWTRISSTKGNLMQQSFCSKCGAAITADTKFCSSCGAAIHAPTSTVTSTAQVQVQAEENRDASILDSTLNVLVGPLKNGFVFFAIYFIFMLPTYYLPYVGSNSALLNVATSAAGLGLSPQFWMHVACLFVLVVVTWLRGCVIGKQWITVFPVIAGLFDMTPGLSIIPFVPTTMHVIALIMGVRGTGKDTSDVRVPVLGAAVSAVGAFVVVSGLLYSWAWPSRLESARPATAPSTTTAVSPQAAVPASQINPTGPEAVPQNMASKASKVSTIVGGWYNGGDYRANIGWEPSKSAYRLRIWNNESRPENAFETFLFGDGSQTRFADSKAKYDGDGQLPPKLVIYHYKKDLLQIYLNEAVQDKSGNLIGPGSHFPFNSDFRRDE